MTSGRKWRCAIALDTLVAGRYSGSYSGGGDVGITNTGYDISLDGAYEDVNETDAYGNGVIDAVYRLGRCSIYFDSLAYKAGSLKAYWSWASFGSGGIVGRLASSVAAALVLSATAGTPAAANPASLTAPLAIVAAGSGGRINFNSKLRHIPCRMEILYDGSKWFTAS